MTEKKYLLIASLVCLILFGSIVTVNFLVNPLGIYPTPGIKGFNQAYPASAAFTRLHKYERVKAIKPDVLITGTSRADSGINPNPAYFNGLKVYNFGLPASNILESRKVLEFAQTVHPLKKVIITLDFHAFNATLLQNGQFPISMYDPKELTPVKAFINTYKTVTSLDTMMAVNKHFRYIKHLDRNAYNNEYGYKVSNDIADRLKYSGYAYPFINLPKPEQVGLDKYTYNYSKEIGDDTFQHFEAMLDFARTNNIDVIMVISPIHIAYQKLLSTAGADKMVAGWKERLVSITHDNAVKYNAKPFALWDFYYPNSLTSEKVPAEGDLTTEMKYFWDSSHYKAAMGDIILQKILGRPEANKYPDFGRRLL